MLWFYKDREGGRQGPFYPGQMRQWYVSGFFPASQLVAPSFKGEIPREYARLDAFYTNATEREAAFDRGAYFLGKVRELSTRPFHELSTRPFHELWLLTFPSQLELFHQGFVDQRLSGAPRRVE